MKERNKQERNKKSKLEIVDERNVKESSQEGVLVP